METKNYFQHDYRSRSDKKLIKIRMKHQMAGIGIYWCLVEMLHEGNGCIDNDLETLAFELGADINILKDVIDICFEIDGDKIVSERVIKNLEFREEKRLANVERAKKGAEARWNKDGERKQKESLKDAYSMLTNAKEKEKEKEKVKETEIDKDKGIANKTLYNSAYDPSAFDDLIIN